MSGAKTFNKLLKIAKTDPDILGFVVGGSRGKGNTNKFSDYDLAFIVKDNKLKAFEKRYPYPHIEKDVSIYLFGYTEYLTQHRKWEFLDEWIRSAATSEKLLVDKTKTLQKAQTERSLIPKDKLRKYVSMNIGAYINYVYRSIKSFRKGETLAARIQAVESLSPFLYVAFALDERRPRPYYDYLRFELKQHPLKSLPISSNGLLESMSKIVNSGNIKTQQRLFKMFEKVCRKRGFGKVFDDWNPDSIELIKKYDKKVIEQD